MDPHLLPDFIEAEVSKRVNESLKESATYEDAIKYYRSKLSLKYTYGEMGVLIDNAAIKQITAHALKNEIN